MQIITIQQIGYPENMPSILWNHLNFEKKSFKIKETIATVIVLLLHIETTNSNLIVVWSLDYMPAPKYQQHVRLCSLNTTRMGNRLNILHCNIFLICG
jgi:hypothetical protein